MNEFEKQLMKCVHDSFREETDNKVIEIATNRDQPQCFIAQEIDSGEFEHKTIETAENLMIEIVRKTDDFKHIRVVFKSPKFIVINKIPDSQAIIRSMVEKANDILNSPPYDIRTLPMMDRGLYLELQARPTMHA